MQRRRWILLFVFLAAIVMAIGYAFLPGPVPVEVTKVSRGKLVVTVREEGKTRVVDRFTVSSPVAGIARRVTLEAGDRVSRGQPLVEIDPAPPPFLDLRRKEVAEAKVSAAQASLESAKEQARVAAAKEEYARSTFERTAKLHESGFESRDALEAAESGARQARAELGSLTSAVNVARSELDAARAELLSVTVKPGPKTRERVTVRSPVEGSVLAIQHKSEGAVREGEPLITIGDPRSLEVEVDVLSTDAVRIRPGSRVIFTRWGGEPALEGKVREVEPAGFTKVSALGVEEQRVLVIANIVSPREAWTRLGDGYRLEADFVIWEGEGILQVPAAALFRHGEGWAAFAADGGRARLRPVQAGQRSGQSAQILSGLSEGARVIVHPSEQVRDGVRIRVR
ncbi:MAG: efflux RND transporter periplasmic adaptor subunit [Deltaproteobacteria bacterium]|nr:HlyD family efflux transporter periplasmic adaptor subunit [Candidatus Deferrimicrobiaceae bacterium]